MHNLKNYIFYEKKDFFLLFLTYVILYSFFFLISWAISMETTYYNIVLRNTFIIILVF